MRKFIDFLINKKHVLVTNDYAKAEALRNILNKNFASEKDFEDLMSNILVANTLSADSIPKLAEKDQPILRGALANKADFLLTSDRKDFAVFMKDTSLKTQVVTPEMLAKKLGLKQL